jgi:CheY-like chemotaxis protein
MDCHRLCVGRRQVRPEQGAVRALRHAAFHTRHAFKVIGSGLQNMGQFSGSDMTKEFTTIVCIVDDDDELRATMRHQLEDAGLRVFESANGRDGVESAEKTGAAIAIVDIVMPDQEGLETIRTLRMRIPGIRLLAMSGFASNYLEMAKKFGADDVLRKPFTGRELVTRVHQLLED